MTTDEIESAAMQAARTNEPDPPTDLLDAALYLALYQLYATLYATLYAGQLTREQARPIKLQLFRRYNNQKSAMAFREKLLASSVQLWTDIEGASNTYCKEPSVANADKLIEAIYRVKRKENLQNESGK